MKKKYKVLIAIAVVSVVLGLTISYSKAITGTVVDAETGKPIEGAVVLVEWTRRAGIGDYHTISVRVAETATEKDGKFKAFGPLHPFVDPVSVTIYKKGYIAWNNKFTFPNYEHRKQYQDMYDQIRLEHFEDNYSYNKHTLFIGTCISDAFASHKKRRFTTAYQWELDLARKEVLRGK